MSSTTEDHTTSISSPFAFITKALGLSGDSDETKDSEKATESEAVKEDGETPVVSDASPAAEETSSNGPATSAVTEERDTPTGAAAAAEETAIATDAPADTDKIVSSSTVVSPEDQTLTTTTATAAQAPPAGQTTSTSYETSTADRPNDAAYSFPYDKAPAASAPSASTTNESEHATTAAEAVKERAEHQQAETTTSTGAHNISTNAEEAHAYPAPPALVSHETSTTVSTSRTGAGADDNASMIPLGKGHLSGPGAYTNASVLDEDRPISPIYTGFSDRAEYFDAEGTEAGRSEVEKVLTSFTSIPEAVAAMGAKAPSKPYTGPPGMSWPLPVATSITSSTGSGDARTNLSPSDDVVSEKTALVEGPSDVGETESSARPAAAERLNTMQREELARVEPNANSRPEEVPSSTNADADTHAGAHRDDDVDKEGGTGTAGQNNKATFATGGLATEAALHTHTSTDEHKGDQAGRSNVTSTTNMTEAEKSGDTEERVKQEIEERVAKTGETTTGDEVLPTIDLTSGDKLSKEGAIVEYATTTDPDAVGLKRMGTRDGKPLLIEVGLIGANGEPVSTASSSSPTAAATTARSTLPSAGTTSPPNRSVKLPANARDSKTASGGGFLSGLFRRRSSAGKPSAFQKSLDTPSPKSPPPTRSSPTSSAVPASTLGAPVAAPEADHSVESASTAQQTAAGTERETIADNDRVGDTTGETAASGTSVHTTTTTTVTPVVQSSFIENLPSPQSPKRDVAIGTDDYSISNGYGRSGAVATAPASTLVPASVVEQEQQQEDSDKTDSSSESSEEPIEVVPDNRSITEIAATTPLPEPAYTAKTVARHERERKKREHAEMIERERLRVDAEMRAKQERILNAYSGKMDFSKVPKPTRTKPFGKALDRSGLPQAPISPTVSSPRSPTSGAQTIMSATAPKLRTGTSPNMGPIHTPTSAKHGTITVGTAANMSSTTTQGQIPILSTDLRRNDSQASAGSNASEQDATSSSSPKLVAHPGYGPAQVSETAQPAPKGNRLSRVFTGKKSSKTPEVRTEQTF